METKKKSKVNLERYRLVFFQAGLIIAISLMLFAFEWSTSSIAIPEHVINGKDFIEPELIQPTRQEEPERPKPQTPVKLAEVINIVDDTEILEYELEIQDVEVGIEDEVIIPELEPEEDVYEQIWVAVEEMPEFPGGEIALIKYIAKNIVYPRSAVEAGIEGKVYLKFAVTKTGNVDYVSVLRGVNPDLNKEAIRVIKSLPKWKPGRQGGKLVNVWYNVPIHFRLTN
jgi:protein TonB